MQEGIQEKIFLRAFPTFPVARAEKKPISGSSHILIKQTDMPSRQKSDWSKPTFFLKNFNFH